MAKRYSITGGYLFGAVDTKTGAVDMIVLASVTRIYAEGGYVYIYTGGKEVDVTGVKYAVLLEAWIAATVEDRFVLDNVECVDITKADNDG